MYPLHEQRHKDCDKALLEDRLVDESAFNVEGSSVEHTVFLNTYPGLRHALGAWLPQQLWFGSSTDAFARDAIANFIVYRSVPMYNANLLGKGR